MKEGRYAIYLGKEYTSGCVNREGKIILRSTDLMDVNKGFELHKPFKIKNCKENIVCIKYVKRSEVEAYYKLTTYAYYKGYKFQVIEEKDDMISIWSLFGEGDYKVWVDLGMKNVNKGEYQKWIKKSEAKIEIEKEML